MTFDANPDEDNPRIMQAADRRRINAPAGGTTPPVFNAPKDVQLQRPSRTRTANEHRKIFLRTGIVPSASGSAYFELPPQRQSDEREIFAPSSSNLKISCTVHGPRPLPRNAQFSPNLLLSANIKFAPFATRNRRGYVRDGTERDLSVHLETALRGVVIGERFPKSACDVVITVLEGEEDSWWVDSSEDSGGGNRSGWGAMTVLAGCITAASAALVDAGIDCLDLVSGGVAAITSDAFTTVEQSKEVLILDPSPAEHETISAACVVAYLQSRDEITEMWLKGDPGSREQMEKLVDEAVKAATLSRTVLEDAVKDGVEMKMKMKNQANDSSGASKQNTSKGENESGDIIMTD